MHPVIALIIVACLVGIVCAAFAFGGPVGGGISVVLVSILVSIFRPF